MAELPAYTHPPQHWIDRPEWVKVVTAQVVKDFSLQGLPLNWDIAKLKFSEIIVPFAEKLRQSELVHSPKFISLLYQLDIRESAIRHRLHTTPPNEIYAMLAYEILKRCAEKVAWRERMKER